MLKMFALEINKKNYFIAAALLDGGFLTVPKKDTYGTIVVINQIIGSSAGPVRNATGRRTRFGRAMAPYHVIRGGRTLMFENVWYDRAVFDAEFDYNTHDLYTGDFVEIARKPEPEVKASDLEEVEDCECEPRCMA